MKKIIFLFLVLAAQSASAQMIMTGEGGGSSGGGGGDKPIAFIDPTNQQWSVNCPGKGAFVCPRCSIANDHGKISEKTLSDTCDLN